MKKDCDQNPTRHFYSPIFVRGLILDSAGAV